MVGEASGRENSFVMFPVRGYGSNCNILSQPEL